jgi:excisionase family DNA binding protein
MQQLLSLKHVAQLTQTSEAFWRKALFRRLLPAVRVGRAVRIREGDLEHFLAERAGRTRSGAES